VTGVIHVLDEMEDRRFNENDLALLTLFTSHAMIAMENARLYEQAQNEITERGQAQEALKNSQEMLQSIFASMPDSITVVDPNGIIRLCNQSTADVHGYPSVEQLIGKNFLELIAEEDHQIAMEGMLQVMANGILKDTPFAGLKANGGKFAGELSVSVIKDSTGNISGFVGITKDITDRKRMEDERRESEARFRAVVEHSNDGILFGDANANILYRSPSYTRINGFGDEERVGHSGFDTVHPDDLEGVRSYWMKLIEHPETTHKTEYRIKHKDGTWRWIETSGQNLLDNPDVHSVVITSRDITERKNAEESLQESESKFRSFIEQSSDGVVLIDEQNKIIEWNAAQEKIAGISRAEAFGTPYWDIQYRILPPERQAQRSPEYFKTAMESALANGQIPQSVSSTEIAIQTPGGERKTILQVSFPIRTENGYRIGAVVRDVTERKRADEELHRQMEELQHWYDVTIDRETRTLELKHEVNELLRRLNEPTRYASADPAE
jgi:PAS domain S-box-containing protein